MSLTGWLFDHPSPAGRRRRTTVVYRRANRLPAKVAELPGGRRQRRRRRVGSSEDEIEAPPQWASARPDNRPTAALRPYARRDGRAFTRPIQSPAKGIPDAASVPRPATDHTL
ncbi:hypothetical protein [Haloarcula nitratireducens]|uniref:Uncharacterized protein n=1 Tax=Haloarcula nitratireducens TaxID=2487749 RepID=A0AAW4P9W2_9EURY|nr:hypothetical protein [Halomicroarcula nitratireducens]MBX0294543.1 hypothetical protein [Halomicroarcula nitratireducens]